MSGKKTIIAGGGLTGLSAACRCEELGKPYLLFEKDREVGGLCCSQKVGGFIFDRGGHVLHFRDPGSLSLVKKFLGTNIRRHTREALFYAFGRYGHYPFQAHLGSMPRGVVRACLSGAARASRRKPARGQEDGDFASWVTRHFGTGLARHFFFPYNAKFWRVPLRDLTSEWARHVIPVPTYEQIAAGARNQNSKAWGYNAVFWYPRKGGIQELPLAMASGLKHVVTGCAIKSIDAGKKEVVVAAGAKEKFDRLITTVPMPELLPLLKNVPVPVRRAFSRLRWNSILNVHLGIEGSAGPEGHWVYFPENAISFFRAGLPHRISRSLVPRGMSALSLEIAYLPGQAPDLERLLDRAVTDAREAGLIPPAGRVSFADAHDIAYGYPVYDRHYARAKEVITSFLRALQIVPAGRYGAWRYMSMEDALREGRALAEVA